MQQLSTKIAQFYFVLQSNAFCAKKAFVISHPKYATSQARLYEAFELLGWST